MAGGGQGAGVELLAWPRRVRPGDELRVETEVIATRPSRSRPNKGYHFANITFNQNGEPVQTGTTTVRCRKAGKGGTSAVV